MPKFRVCVVESRDYIFEIEADTQAEAEDAARDTDVSESTSDSFRENVVDWCEKIS